MILVFARVERTLLSVVFDFNAACHPEATGLSSPKDLGGPRESPAVSAGDQNRAFGPLPYRLCRQSSLAQKHKRRRPKGLRRCFLDSIYSEYQTKQGNCVIFGQLIFTGESMS